MTPAINQDQQGAAQRRSRGHSVGAAVNAAPAIVDHQNQSRAVTARHVSQTCVPLLALHLAGLRAPSFSHLPGATLHTTRQRRLRHPLPRGAATFIRRSAWRAAAQFCFSDHVPAKFADRSEAAHLERLSCASVADDRNQTTEALANGSILLPREENV